MINLCECSLDELRAEICAAIEAVDAVLGRPPFPNPVSAEVVGAAHRAERALLELQARNRVGMVENCVEVHTTLPILCAALRTGSVNESPCLLMLRIMLSCLTVVMSLAKFPLSGLLKDAQELLPSDDVVLFKLLVASGTFTTDHMRVRLGLPPSTSATTTSRAAPRSKKPRTPKECPTRPPPALLKAMLEAPLHDECRTLLLSLCDTTSTFLDTVQGDGDVAALILSIHGEHLIPLLTPSSLLPCMRPGLADYFVDVMERQEGNVLLCSDANLLQVPPTSWSHSTLSDLCAYMDERPVHQQDAFGSLMVSAFLMQVLNRMAPQLLLDGAWAASDSDRCRLQLVEAGCHAAVLLGQRIHPDGHVFRPLQRQANLEVDPAEEQWLHLLSILLATGYDDVDRQLHGSSCPWLEEVLHTLVLPSLRMKALPPDVCPPQKMHASVTKKKTKTRGGTDVSAEKESGKSCAQAYSAGTFLDHMSIVVEAATLLCPLHAGTVVEVIDAFVAVMQVALTNRLLPSTTACTALLRSISVRAWRKLRAHELHVDVPWTSMTEDVLRHATTVSCSCAWCVPFLVDDDGQAARVQLWGVQLTSSLIAVALVGRRRESERWLYPWSSEYVLGWLSDALTADQLDAVSTVIRASGAAPAAAAYVEKLLLEANKMVVPEGVPWLIGIEARNVSLESCQDGWQRVRDALLHASSREAAADEARRVAKRESEAAAMRARLAEDVRLANEQRLFNEEKDKKMQLIHQVQTSVRETCGERAREHADRQRAKQERQRQLQTEARARYLDEQKTLHAQNAQRRRERFVAYQRRMSSAFRVQDFLEHLDLLPSRVMELMAAVQPYLDDISPDELLEFAVTGARRVPEDMQASLSTHPSIHDDGGEAASTQHHLHFWDEVVHGRETDMASQAAMRLTDSGHSYHYRLSPWLDLFSYDVQEDDEDGVVPAILPSVHVSAAVRVLPSGQVSSMGLASVMDGFLSLQRHRLVCLRSDVAQLTVLGFRYHYPFSEDWNCVEARLARMPAMRLAQLPWEADAESEDDNTDTEEDADAVLPPVEFGI